jgi:hypothetical protein
MAGYSNRIHPHPLVGRYFRVARNVKTRDGRVITARHLVYVIAPPEHGPRGAWVPVRAGYRGTIEHVPLTVLRDVPRRAP